MTPRSNLFAMTAVAALLSALPVLAQNALAPRDGAPGNPPSTATQRAADGATGNGTPADGTPDNPPGTALGRAADRALGTNMSGAYPQNSDGTAGNPPGTAAGRAAERAAGSVGNGPAATGEANNGAVATGTVGTTGGMGLNRPAARGEERRASRIVGASVYNDRNETIGSVDDLVLSDGGSPTAVVSVGGFLGIGSKLVAVPFNQMRWNAEQSRWVLNGVTKDSLTALPAFSYSDQG
ncbi:PRC-barrel domain-containing protein [Roseomonas elaeocarpi]|uniref:PRC-barrel domain-containing protein n=1 Tax=Roseomonas elaeocarpi TaxID=907779 RepID=A0ABV6JSI5_9PROT